MVSLLAKEEAIVQNNDKMIDENNNYGRTPIDLVCVIDHSGSMGGEKIDLVRKTLKSIVELFGDNDRLCLI